MVPFIAIQQSSYDVIKQAGLLLTSEPRWGRCAAGGAPGCAGSRARARASSLALFTSCGLVAGTLAQATTYPIDLVRKRIQVADKRLTTAQVVRAVVARHGVRGLFSGLSATVFRVRAPGLCMRAGG